MLYSYTPSLPWLVDRWYQLCQADASCLGALLKACEGAGRWQEARNAESRGPWQRMAAATWGISWWIWTTWSGKHSFLASKHLRRVTWFVCLFGCLPALFVCLPDSLSLSPSHALALSLSDLEVQISLETTWCINQSKWQRAGENSQYYMITV